MSSILCHVGITEYPPCDCECDAGVATFDTMIFVFPSGSEHFGMIGDLYFGLLPTPGGTGYTTNASTFLAANPGLTHQTFAGIAPAGGSVYPSPLLPGFTSVWPALFGPGDSTVFDLTNPGVPFHPMPFCSLGTDEDGLVVLTFSPGINVIGFKTAVFPSIACEVALFLGGVTGVEVDDQTFTPDNPGTFTTFYGFS